MRSNNLTIEFDKMSPSKKTGLYTVTGYDTHLGDIKWSGNWKQYVFFPEVAVVIPSGWLGDIADFCDFATERHSTKVRLT
jgi:hypothetical protein